MFDPVVNPLAVVPIFVNAGAALLPAIIAGATSLFALLISPRAMARLCRRRPWVPVVVVAAGIGLWFLPGLISRGAARGAVARPIDWAAIARGIQNPHPLLSPLWENDLDGAMALSTPAIHADSGANPILYVPTTLQDIGGQTGSLYAFNALTGKQVWIAFKDLANHDLKPFFSSPAVSADGAYLVIGQGLHEDKDSPLLCFGLHRPGHGEQSSSPPPLAWSVPTPLHVESSPAIFSRGGESFAVVGAGAIEDKDGRAIGNPGYVFCVALATGKQIWQQPVNDPESSPAVDENGIVYIGSGLNGNAVVALRSQPDAALGGQSRQVWKTPTPFPATGHVALAHDRSLGNLVLIGIGNGDFVFSAAHPLGAVLALDRANGKILWQAALPDCVLGPLLVAGNIVLAPCKNGDAFALNLSDGRILWHQQISDTPHIPILAGLATDGPHAFALAADGTLAVLSLADKGAILDSIKLSDEAKSPQNLTCSTPLYSAGILYVGTETMGLQAYKITQPMP